MEQRKVNPDLQRVVLAEDRDVHGRAGARMRVVGTSDADITDDARRVAFRIAQRCEERSWPPLTLMAAVG